VFHVEHGEIVEQPVPQPKCSTWNMAELNDITEGCGIKESAAPWRTTGRLKRRFAKSLSELIAIFAE
jgi:hypothetical protein